ncbi:MAG: 50S ribosomal protein L11 [Chloroflexi bacterium HGW-Chloroflexi-9]|nr:50S ribosomal protein L11 [Dehalococcoidia bacterium]PKN79705.1 MAG: 50S ribosomal protein L11 [Chloroflexi bacterium HGW-Chloroflexi-9]
MAKKVRTVVTLQLPAGAANPAPPVGTALGPHGINIMEFCKGYNEQTKGMIGVIPAKVTIFEDRSFSFVLKTPPASDLLRRAAGVDRGSSKNIVLKVGKISQQQLRDIATIKLPDLNTGDLDTAMKIVAGSARSMGIEVED